MSELYLNNAILFNYLFIFIIPFLFGFIFRLALHWFKRGILLTLGTIIFAVFTSIAVAVIPAHGNEFYGLFMYQSICIAVGAIISEAILFIRKALKK